MDTDLSNVNVTAGLINLRVVEVENGGVQLVVGRDFEASISRRDDVSGLAVFLGLQSKAKFATDFKVSAVSLVFASVGHGELITRKSTIRTVPCYVRYETTYVETF